ncbi:FtsX-like permease family protein [Telmatospirillum sp.]|uniref:ABC transporter permease n=1 Tax=Telmatospirillum sp. TaxID=2079197 RepID=UPI002848A8D0|nr:FtsX-like permease family protein [Telmatospirillum sp.]MDR3439419.1 FtsX-like permease family protein [Telmatospirillum sp.]
MMLLLKIAFRNVLRNARRSLMTMSTVAIGFMAITLFGEFMAYITIGFQTGTVERSGHLSVFRTGYFDFGAGNPAAYGISDYSSVIGLIKSDPELSQRLAVVTPTVTLFGIAGNFDIDASKTFFGLGVVPSDRDRMLQWDEYGLMGDRPPQRSGLHDDMDTQGVVGVGLARILGLCQALDVADCKTPPKPAAAKVSAADSPPAVDLAELASRDVDPSARPKDGARIDLLAATAGGAPNVMALTVTKAERQGVKELDDNFVAMHLQLAQQLLYGRGEHKAVAIVLQLQRSEDMALVRTRLNALFHDKGLDLEVRDFTELQPQYNQIIGLFGAIFSFIAIVMGMIVLFTVVNTMSMSVMERTDEIGTARAMGVRRQGIRRQFLLEGWFLGAFGASAGLFLADVAAFGVNRCGWTWTPPGQSAAIPFRLLTSGVAPMIAAVWLGLVLIATIASLVPANRAARMAVVDALRHV